MNEQERQVLSDLLEWAKNAAVEIDGEWGDNRTIEELLGDEALDEPIINAVQLLATRDGGEVQ